jgi:hypothetical protein
MAVVFLQENVAAEIGSHDIATSGFVGSSRGLSLIMSFLLLFAPAACILLH